MKFQDRTDAGRQLAAAVAERVDADGVTVLGLPRGGVPVAAAVAEELGAPLDVLLVRKVGHPHHREFAIGAVAEGGVEVRSDDTAARMARAEVDQAVELAQSELADRASRYRGVRTAAPVDGRTVVVVDDGVATGSTARVALTALRERSPRRLVLAVPVASPRGIETLQDVVDEVVCLHAPRGFRAVGQFYRDFSATTDDEVRRLLDRFGATDDSAVDASDDPG